MKDNKLVEKYDDNPGAYFGMLVEGFEELKESGEDKIYKSEKILKFRKWANDSKFNIYWELGNLYDAASKNEKKLKRAVKIYNSNNNTNLNVETVFHENEYFFAVYFIEKIESLKEDKFVSRDKMSKKDKKELDNQKRNTWGNTNPVTRIQPNKKAYDRKRDSKVIDEDIENENSEDYLGVYEAKKFVDVREKLLELSDSMTTDLRQGTISKEDVLYYRNELKELSSYLNSLYFGKV